MRGIDKLKFRAKHIGIPGYLKKLLSGSFRGMFYIYRSSGGQAVHTVFMLFNGRVQRRHAQSPGRNIPRALINSW